MSTASTTIARPYAKAIFELALLQQQLDQWSSILRLLAIIASDSAVMTIIHHPAVTAEQLVALLAKIGGTALNEGAHNLLRVLAQHKRLSLLPEINVLYEIQRAEQQKMVVAKVTTAMPMSEIQQQHLVKALQRRLQREITLEIILDSSVLGGAIIRVGDLLIDGSLRGKLNRLSSMIAA